MRNRFAIIILALAAVAVAFAARPEGEAKEAVKAAKPTGAAANAVVVPFVYSTEKKQLMDTLVERFNRSQRAVVVKGQAIASGEVQTKIAAGKLKPVAWSPASSLWGSLLNYEADRQLAPESEPLLQTPLVIAMWEPMARAMGWPRQQVGFAELVRLARSGAGWGDFGHPQWGAFKLVHTNPDFSTSGLEAVVAEYYAATGKREGLTEDDISSRARRIVRDLERSIVHYGDTTPFIAEQLKKHGPGYASAAVMEETTVVAFNRTRGKQQRLVALYPTEGTFYSDSPFIVLNGDWVRPDQRRAAETFRRFLIEQITPEVAAQGGMRPADLDTAPVAPVTAANGVDPKQPTRVLGLPEPRVLARLKETWRADRKPANVLLVLDVSGSMVRGEAAPTREGRGPGLPRARGAAGPDRADRVLHRRGAADQGRVVREEPRSTADGSGRADHRWRHDRCTTPPRRPSGRSGGCASASGGSTPSCSSPTARTPVRSCASISCSRSSIRATVATRYGCSRSPTAPARTAR